MSGVGPRAAPTRLATGTFVVSMAIAFVGAVLVLLSWDAPQPPWGVKGFAVVLSIIFATMGFMLVKRVPGNPIGALFCVSGLITAIQGVCDGYLAYGHVAPGMPGLAWAAWANEWIWVPAIGSITVVGFLLYPTGSLPTPRWRPALYVALGGTLFSAVAFALAPGRFVGREYSNPAGVEALVPFIGRTGDFWTAIPFFGAVVIGAAAVITRFVRARGDERMQMKWFAFGALGIAVGMLLNGIFEGSEVGSNVGEGVMIVSFFSVPVAMGVAIMKYRLYDIDVVVNRALVYGVLSVMLAAAYLGAVALLQQILPVEGNDLAVAASTLTAAALFAPLRRRVQEFVDRRFYRAKYDAAYTIESFSSRLRQETDLEELQTHILEAVGSTMQPAHASVWFREAKE